MKHRIFICEEVAQEVYDFFESHKVKVKRGERSDEETLIRDLQDCDAVLVRTLKISRHTIENCPGLKVIAKHGTGCDSIDVVAAQEYGIPVVYSPGANAHSVAEHTMALILACSKKLKLVGAAYASGNYHIKNAAQINEICGKTLGLVGFGNVAKIVAKMAFYGFDMKLIVYDPYIDRQKLPSHIYVAEDLSELMSKADFVSIHIPLAASTKGLIDEKMLSCMKRSAVLINTSRGEVVDTKALERVVNQGLIAGAGLDVSDPEPYVQGELFDSPNVILTPHSAAATNEAMVRMGVMAAQGVVDVYSGKKPEYLFRI